MLPNLDDSIRTRTTLIHRLKNWDDQSSWQDFFDTYWKLIYGFARKSGLNDAEAQDVVQETMFSVAKHMPTFKYDRRIGSFKSWLFKLTRWRIVDQARKKSWLIKLTRWKVSDQPEGIEKDSSFALDKNVAKLETVTVNEIEDPESQRSEALWEEEWKKSLLEAAIVKVKTCSDPEKYQIFDFYVNKNWEAKKVAEKFRISIGQVYLAKHRVTELIKEEVERLEENVI